MHFKKILKLKFLFASQIMVGGVSTLMMLTGCDHPTEPTSISIKQGSIWNCRWNNDGNVEVTTALIYDYVASFKVFDNLGNNVYEQISYTCQLNPDQIKTDYQPFARITKSHSDFEIRYIDPEPKNPGTEMLVNLELDLASGNQLKYAFKILRI